VNSQYSDERFGTFLLDAGAPLDGLSPRQLLRLVRSVAVFNRLMARNVDLFALRDQFGGTLCHHVAVSVARETDDDLRFLLNACGTDAVRVVDNNGRTPLHWISSISDDSVVRILVELGADIDSQDNDGMTALFNASRWPAQISRLEMLLALCASVRLVTKHGQAPCHLAAAWQQNVGLCALVAAGGDLDQLDYKSESPRMIAARRRVSLPTADEIDVVRKRIARTRLDFVRHRAAEICIGLHQLNLDALQLCEIMVQSFGAIGSLIAFHQWWAIATKVKHFHRERTEDDSSKL
jgi:hypothetical protein